jgi:hypothetical protein
MDKVKKNNAAMCGSIVRNISASLWSVSEEGVTIVNTLIKLNSQLVQKY